MSVKEAEEREVCWTGTSEGGKTSGSKFCKREENACGGLELVEEEEVQGDLWEWRQDTQVELVLP